VADAHFQLGEWAEAFGIIERAGRLPGSSAARVDLAVTGATIRLWGLGDPESALATLEGLRSDAGIDAAGCGRLDAEIASVLVNAGHPGRARTELEGAVNGGDLRLRLGAAVAYANASAMAGETDVALAVIDRALHDRPSSGMPGVADVDTHHVARAFALIEAGRLADGLAVAAAGYEAAIVAARPLSQFWFALLMGRAALGMGAPTSAIRHLMTARALGRDTGLTGPIRSALIGATIAHGMLRDAAAAAAAIAEIDTLPTFDFMAPDRWLALGAAAVASGDLTAARLAFLSGVDPAVETGHLTSAIWMLHEAARLAGPAEVVERITSLAAGLESPLARARAEHVRALVSMTATDLSGAADRFEALGANLLAAEAAISGAEAARGAGDQRTATSLTRRAERLLDRCEGAQTFGLVSTRTGVDPLTDREREIAFLAAGGRTSRQIAEQLFLSYRTVNNHLQHIYDKLGARGRAGLQQALGLDADQP
jgi:DNA-binding CsgD family transcriptional regulator